MQKCMELMVESDALVHPIHESIGGSSLGSKGLPVSSLLYAFGQWTVHARKFVLVTWAVAIMALGASAGLLNQGLDQSVTIPGTEAQSALDSLGRTFPEFSGTQAQILVVAEEGRSVEDPEYRDSVESTVAELEDLDGVSAVVSPYDTTVQGGVNDDKSAAIITVLLDDGLGDVTDSTKDNLQDVTDQLESALPQAESVTLGGPAFSVVLPTVTIIEAIGVVAAFIILAVTFGSMLAAGMPILIAFVGVAASIAILFLSTGLLDINSATPIAALMLGLAVGIDYSLFIISRHREQLRDGLPVKESIARAVATSGSAVLFAGITVVVALLALAIAGVPFLSIMGLFTAIGIATAVVCSLTMLPALLAVAGEKLRPAPPKQPKQRKRRNPRSPKARANAFEVWVRTVTRHPIMVILGVTALLGSSLIPAMDMRLGLPDSGALHEENEARVTYDKIAEEFGDGYNATLVVTGSVIHSDDPVGLVNDMADDIRGMEGVASVPLATPNQGGDTAIIQIIPTGGPSDDSTKELVDDLRAQRGHFDDEYGVDISVTGQSAVAIDVSDKLGSATIPFGLVVVGLSLVLLTAVFRSVWVPVKATVGYLLSLSAAFGAVALVFEHGILAEFLHVARQGPVMSFTPIIVMGVLFGLSMDYELFLVSRIREDYVHGKSAREAIVSGFTGSAKVITAAALIMFVVFAAFVPEGDATAKPMALALAVGVFVDAFIVRMTLVPAVLALLGEKAWWIPRRLDRMLPRFDVEGEDLVHALSLQDWPGVPAAVAADDVLVAVDPGHTWTALVSPGDLHLVSGPRVAVTGALRAATGRLKHEGGNLKVLDRVCPGLEAVVRRETQLLDVTDAADPAAEVERNLLRNPRILAIDGLDDHSHLVIEAVRHVIDRRGPQTTVLVGAPTRDLAHEFAEADSRSTVTLQPATLTSHQETLA